MERRSLTWCLRDDRNLKTSQRVVIAVAVKEKVMEKRKRKEEVGRSDTSRKQMSGCERSNTGKGEEV